MDRAQQSGRPVSAGPPAARGRGTLRSAIALHPHAQAYNNLAYLELAEDRTGEALADARRAVASTATPSAEMLNNRGLAFARLGRLDSARADFDRALAASPDYVPAIMNRAELLVAMGRFDEARPGLERVVRLLPGQPEPWCMFGDEYVKQGRLDDAVQAYRRALAIRPTDGRAAYSLAATLARAGHRSEALELARAIVRGNPSFTQAAALLHELEPAPPP